MATRVILTLTHDDSSNALRRGAAKITAPIWADVLEEVAERLIQKGSGWTVASTVVED